MKKVLFILTVLITLSFISCSKDKTEPEKPYQPVFDLRVKENHSEFEKETARNLAVLWQFTYKEVKNPQGKVMKLQGITRNENNAGKNINILENTVGKQPVYVYYQLIVNFEAKNEIVAKRFRDVMGGMDTKLAMWTAVKNILNPNFNIERDLKHLNPIIAEMVINKAKQILKNDFNAGLITITNYTKEPIKSIK